MKNKLGQAMAVGITAIASASVAITGLIMGQDITISIVMAAPVCVTLFILAGDGWE